MKKTLIVYIGIVCFLSVGVRAPVYAQSLANSDYFYALNTGVVSSAAPNFLPEYWDPGFNIGIGMASRDANSYFTDMWVIEYSRLALNKPKFKADHLLKERDTITRANNATLSIFLLYKFHQPEIRDINPFVSVGAGYFRNIEGIIKATDGVHEQQWTALSQNSYAGTAGIGIDFNINTMYYLSAEISVVNALTRDQWSQYYPVKMGIAFKFTQ